MTEEKKELLRAEILQLIDDFCENSLPTLIEAGLSVDDIMFGILERQIALVFKNHGELPEEFSFMLPS